MSYAFMAFWVGLFQKYDVVVATSPQFFTTWAGFALGKIKRKQWVFELRDLWPETIKSVGAMKQGKAIELLEKIELFLYRNSSQVIAVTDAFKRNLIGRGIDESKISVVTNGSNIKLFMPRDKDKKLLKELDLEEKFIVGYIGTHGMCHGLDFIVNSLDNIKDENIHFLFIGDGAMKCQIIDISNELALKNITFLDAVSKDKVPSYLSICDISLAPLKKDDNFKNVIPSKIFEASAMQKPTLLGVEGQAEDIIRKYGAGLCFKPEDREDFIDKLNKLRDKQIYKECQDGCIKLANDFSREKLAKKMLNILREIK